MRSSAGRSPELGAFACWAGRVTAAGLLPKFCCHLQRIDVEAVPPLPLVTAPVQLAMVKSTQGHGEFIAHLAAERALLRKAEMMGI
jgi:hypothetical protein